jgi:hypothetical protein
MEGYPSVHPDGKSFSSSDIPPEKNPTVEAWLRVLSVRPTQGLHLALCQHHVPLNVHCLIKDVLRLLWLLSTVHLPLDTARYR